MKAHEQTDFPWRQLRAAEGKFVPELLQLALRECGPELLTAALDEFFLWDGVPEGYTETEAFSSFFVPWFVYEFIDDPHDPDRVSDAPDEPLALLYLRRHRQHLSATEQAFLEAASASPLSFYAVTRVEPGRDMALHDVLTGKEFVVHERSASTMVPAGALLFTRVVTVDRTSIMSGCAPLVIPPAWHLRLLDARDELTRGKRRVLTRDMVRDRDIELRELYFAIEDQVRNPPLPQLRNTDGDRLVSTTFVYRLRCSPSAAFERLKPLARAATGDVTQLLSEAHLDEAGELASVTIPWSKKGNRLHPEWDNTTLGTLAIEGDRLQVDVNSNRRARRIEREIAKRLGGDAVLESRTATPIETLLDERRKSPRDTIDALAQERLEQQPEVQEFLRQQGERHWETWLDTPLPALGTLTPRRAAQTPAGRERLEALFAEFTWMTGQAPNAMAPDVPALRAKLGLRSRRDPPLARVPDTAGRLIVARVAQRPFRSVYSDPMAPMGRIEINPRVMLGKPVLRGTRIPVELVLRKLSEGASEADLLDAYPRLTRDDIHAAMRYAADAIAHEEVVYVGTDPSGSRD